MKSLLARLPPRAPIRAMMAAAALIAGVLLFRRSRRGSR
jgi:hypothetical protein